MAFLGWHANHREQRMIAAGQGPLSYCSWEILLSILVFAIVAGARYGTGYDHIYYLSQYIQLRDMGGFSRTSYEPGFVLISKAFAALNAHAFFYFAFWGALQIGLFYFALRNRKFLLIWVPIIIMFGGFFINWMNSIRQVVVECAFLAMLPLVENKRKMLIACALSLILSTIHFSALLVPFYLLLAKWMNKRSISCKTSLIIFAGCLVLGMFPFWLKVFDKFSYLLTVLGYDRYVAMFCDLCTGGFRFVTWGPTQILMVFAQVLIIWFFPQLKKCYPDDKFLVTSYNLAFFGFCITALLTNTSHYMLRPFEYLLLCEIPLLAYLFAYCFNNKRYGWLAVLAVASCSIIFFAVYKATYYPTDVNQPFLYNIIFCNI